MTEDSPVETCQCDGCGKETGDVLPAGDRDGRWLCGECYFI